MANLSFVASSDHTSDVAVLHSAATYWGSIDEQASDSPTTDAIYNADTNAGTIWLGIGDMPGDFGYMETLHIARHATIGATATNDIIEIVGQIFRADQTSKLTSDARIFYYSSNPPASDVATPDTDITFLGVDTNSLAADWNSALLRLEWIYDQTGGQDEAPASLYALNFWGTYTAAIASTDIFGEATLSGAGTLTAEGARVRPGKASLSGAGTLTASGQRIVEGKASLSGSGTLSARGRRTIEGKASLSGSGTLAARGRRTVEGSASLTASGTLTASGISTPPATTFTGVQLEPGYWSSTYFLTSYWQTDYWGDYGVPAGTVHYAEASLSGTGTLTAKGERIVRGVASLSGSGTLSATGSRTVEGSASLSGTGTLAARGRRTREGKASLSGTGTITCTGITFGDVFGEATLTGTGTLVASGASISPTVTPTGGAKRHRRRDYLWEQLIMEEEELIIIDA